MLKRVLQLVRSKESKEDDGLDRVFEESDRKQLLKQLSIRETASQTFEAVHLEVLSSSTTVAVQYLYDLPQISITEEMLSVDTCIVSYRWLYLDADMQDENKQPVISSRLWSCFQTAKSQGYRYCLIDYFTIDQESTRNKSELLQKDLLRFNEFYQQVPVALAFEEVTETDRLWIDLELWRLFRNPNKRTLTITNASFIKALIQTKPHLVDYINNDNQADVIESIIDQAALAAISQKLRKLRLREEAEIVRIDQLRYTVTISMTFMGEKKKAVRDLEEAEDGLIKLRAALKNEQGIYKTNLEILLKDQLEKSTNGDYGVQGILYSLGMKARREPDLGKHVANGTSTFASDYLFVLLSLEGKSDMVDITRKADPAIAVIPWIELLRAAKLRTGILWQFHSEGAWSMILKPRGWDLASSGVLSKNGVPMIDLYGSEVEGDHIDLTQWNLGTDITSVIMIAEPAEIVKQLTADLRIYEDNKKVRDLLSLVGA